ncbi:breast carcinoma-amplified sequence 4-like [Daphnia pulicaria]|uniref:breast carcinoma-amplified sequence 4-like n=1 Tax=Daphnia pulicaria TaxID=35523 RepID=UPI001EEA1362|nr:breast carcinoma-amplified sequence 4-like [Daphnia pulicaria]
MQSNKDNRKDDLLNELASDYANYLVVDSNDEWWKLQSVIQNLSSNVEEFSSLLESINVDTSLCVDSLLPHIVAHFNQVKKTFRQIDKLESAVKKVEKSVSSMEAELNTAETYLESESVFKTVFKPFLKPSNPTSPVPPVYKPVDIFKTETLWVEDSSAD